ncbi:hypothetical protein BU16DRAFT_145190 [Lophium mytilinum]|uniref:Uncharacterized protein n=1 Tax=Lophium mytilinum TaxID=390894 RepID=A0A6A6QG09_9PEZI|nr:hypothetical protein BU16DRAFT_145190 [Lophium mytilinum]
MMRKDPIGSHELPNHDLEGPGTCRRQAAHTLTKASFLTSLPSAFFPFHSAPQRAIRTLHMQDAEEGASAARAGIMQDTQAALSTTDIVLLQLHLAYSAAASLAPSCALIRLGEADRHPYGRSARLGSSVLVIKRGTCSGTESVLPTLFV